MERKIEDANGLAKTFWLARCDLCRAWLSCAAGALIAVVAGLVAGTLFSGVFVLEGFGEETRELEWRFNNSLVDLWFLAILPALAIGAAFNPDYSRRFTEDNMSRRLSFLRSLPVPSGSITGSRALVSLTSLAITGPLFFGALYLVSGEAQRVPLGEYVSFAGVWLGYTLAVGGLYLYVWLGFGGRADAFFTLGVMLAMVLAVAVTTLTFGTGLVEGSIGLAREHGALAGVTGICAGGSVFALWMLAAARRLSRREL